MDTDIVTLADSFLQDNRHLQLKMTSNDIGLITSWIRMKLMRERQSWKEKLDHAMLEIERQRKVALEWEAKFENNNGVITPDVKLYEPEVSVTQDPSLVSLIESQKNRINHIEKELQQLSSDRKICGELLKIESVGKDVSVSQVLRQTLKTYDNESKTAEIEYRKSLAERDKEIESLRYVVQSLKQEGMESETKPKDNAKTNENGIRVLCYTTTDKLFRDNSKQQSDDVCSDAELRFMVDNLYKEKLRLTADNKKFRDLVISLEDELLEKDSLLRKYEKQIKTLKFDSTYKRDENAKKVVKPGKKTSSVATLEEPLRRQYPGILSLGKYKSKYSSLPSLPISRSAEGPSNSSSPLIQTAKTAVHRCLRCNKLYRLMDNNKFSCHFHKKGKVREEKTAPNGQILGITYRWDCCNKPATVEGCCVSQHV